MVECMGSYECYDVLGEGDVAANAARQRKTHPEGRVVDVVRERRVGRASQRRLLPLKLDPQRRRPKSVSERSRNSEHRRRVERREELEPLGESLLQAAAARKIGGAAWPRFPPRRPLPRTTSTPSLCADPGAARARDGPNRRGPPRPHRSIAGTRGASRRATRLFARRTTAAGIREDPYCR